MGWLIKRKDNEPRRDTIPQPNPLSAPGRGIPRHPALDGLPDNWRAAVVAAGRLRKFGAGDIIEYPGAEAHFLCLVLEGRVAQVVATDGVDTVEMVEAGGHLWIQPEGDDARIKPLAQESVTLLLIDPSGLDTLPDEHQLTVYRVLRSQARSQMRDAILRHAETGARARKARAALKARLNREQALTTGTELIGKIVEHTPRLPAYATQVISLLADETSTAASVVEMAKRDPALAADVLKTINSPLFNLSNKVSDLQHAVVLLGFDQIHQLVVANGVGATMPNTPDARELLLHANAVSFIGMEVARMAGFDKPVVASTIGLLHGIGGSAKLLLRTQFPHLGGFVEMLDGPAVGAALLKAWELPDVICRTVAHQNRPHFLPPEDIGEEHRHETALLYLARLCYHSLCGRGMDGLPNDYLADYQELVGIPAQPMDAFVRNRLFPSLGQRRQTYPDTIRRFFQTCERRVTAGV